MFEHYLEVYFKVLLVISFAAYMHAGHLIFLGGDKTTNDKQFSALSLAPYNKCFVCARAPYRNPTKNVDGVCEAEIAPAVAGWGG